MEPLKPTDSRHKRAILEASQDRISVSVPDTLSAYYASLTAQGVVLVEAYKGDDM